MKLAGIDVRAVSIGGVETCIDLPAHKIAFDVGRAPDFAVAREVVAFTHAHVDHLGGVAWHCATCALHRLPPPTYLVGHENAQALADLFAVWRRLDRSTLAHTLVALGPGEDWRHPRGYLVRPFRSVHRAPCQGYAIVARRKKLDPRFAGASHEEIAAARARGEDVAIPQDVVEVAFPGDTTIAVVEREELVRTARLLVLECTFVDDEVTPEESRAMGHVHLDDIAERADLFANEAILLTHFSPRYSPARIEAMLARKLPPHLLVRVTPLLAER